MPVRTEKTVFLPTCGRPMRAIFMREWSNEVMECWSVGNDGTEAAVPLLQYSVQAFKLAQKASMRSRPFWMFSIEQA